MPDWLTKHWGDSFSTFGFLVSCGTLYFSRRASAAVKEAKAEFRKQSIATRLEAVHLLAQEVEIFLSVGIYLGALIRCRDLSRQLGFILKRWEDDHSRASLIVLVDSKSQVEQMVTKLQGLNPTVPKNEQNRLLGIMQRVTGMLGEEYASAEKRANP